MLRQKAEGIAGGGDLLQADQPATLAFAFAATRHVEAQGHVAELLEHGAGLEHVAGAAVAAEAVQHDERRPSLARADALGHSHVSHQRAILRPERDPLLGHA